MEYWSDGVLEYWRSDAICAKGVPLVIFEICATLDQSEISNLKSKIYVKGVSLGKFAI